MKKTQERIEREARADRLKWARKNAEFSGPTPVSATTGIAVDTVKAHEQGRNGFGTDDARQYAKAFGVSLRWLYFGEGKWDDIDSDDPAVTAIEVPLFTSVTAGALSDNPVDEALGTARAALPPGDWIAFRVEGESMDRISPPGSIIFVDRGDKRLVTGAFYVIDDGSGLSTYKRFQANPMRFEPVSKNKELAAYFPDNEPTIIGRVKLTTLDLM